MRRAGLILINDPPALRRYGQRLKLVRIDSGFEAQLRYGPIVAWGGGGVAAGRGGLAGRSVWGQATGILRSDSVEMGGKKRKERNKRGGMNQQTNVI